MNLRVPAQWEPQECVWIAWPHNLETWPGRFDRIPRFFADWIALISESTPVRLLATADLAQQSRKLLPKTSAIELVSVATNDCWIRDYGPTFVASGEGLLGVNWRYNAWGGKYPPWDLDDAAAPAICRAANIVSVDDSLCLEGGALELDGGGRLLTTPMCLLSETRNEGATRESIAQHLYRRLGVNEIVWLDGGPLAGDDTDGHIDQLARFIDAGNVVVAVCDDADDENHLALEENYRQLRLWADATRPRVTIHRLPIPPARYVDRQRVPESYCNFLRLGQERILVPTFGALSDQAAIDLLRGLSGADVTGVDCRDLAWGLGSLHCASREQPALS